MAQKQNPMRMFIMMPMIFLMGKVDFENLVILNSARAAFFLCQIVSLFVALYLKNKLAEKNDQTKIYVPAATSPFDQTPNYNELTETTYFAHESAKAAEFLKQTGIGAAISTFVHFKMGVNHVVLIQAVMIPMNLYENPLVRKYLLGKQEGRLWNERLEGESGDEVAKADDASKATGAKAGAETKDKKKKTTVAPAEAIAKAWDAGTEADFDELWAVVKSAVNAKTDGDDWTALMVACGSPIDTDDFIKKLVKAGVDVTATDNDGWTALHWSAFHGRPEAAEALLESVAEAKRAKLLAIKAKDGRTAQEVAEGESNVDVTAVLAKFAAGKSVEPTKSAESEIRQRKGAGANTSSVEDVD